MKLGRYGEIIPLKLKKLHPSAQLPKYATLGAAYFDIHCVIEGDSKIDKDGKVLQPSVTIRPGEQMILRTGLAVQIPPEWVMAVYSRSGHGFKSGVRLSNSVGQIDCDYRGEVMVALHNDGRKRWTVTHGERVAQARLEPAPRVHMEFVDELSPTDRGAGGFGSTGS